MLERSLRISTKLDDDGKSLYILSETKTVTQNLRYVSEEEFDEVYNEVLEFNKENSDLNLFKKLLDERAEEMRNSSNPKEYATAILINSGILYPDGTPIEFDEFGDRLSFNEIKNLRNTLKDC
jgi:hypothetical protein